MDKHENIFGFGGTGEIIGGVGRSPLPDLTIALHTHLCFIS